MSALYDLTVPVYIRGLEQLSHLLKLAEKHVDERKIPHEILLESRLALDMRSLVFQVQAARNTAKAILPRVAGLPPVPIEDNDTIFVQLHQGIKQTIEALKTVKATDLIENKDEEVVLRFKRELRYPSGVEYLQAYGMPNFWFHVSMVYAILRNQGVAVGKVDFLGSQYIVADT